MADILLALLLSLVAAAPSATPAPPGAAPEPLPLRHNPDNGSLRVPMGALAALTVREPFRYVGGQRFILKGVADAEQHLFVVADKDQRVERMYWIQIEEMLPGHEGAYDYSEDLGVVVDGLSLAASARTFSAPPAAGSDRERAFELIQSKGYTIADKATRLRLVYLPESPARREVMIIYLETDPRAASDPREDLIVRARGALKFEIARR